MTRVVRYRGLPGAGKTTKMMEEVSNHRAHDGYDHTAFHLISFTRAHRNDLLESLETQFSDALAQMDAEKEDRVMDELEESVTTAHSAALELSGVMSDGVITPEQNPLTDGDDLAPYTEFFSQYGIEFGERQSNPLKVLNDGGDVPVGTQLISINQWLRLHCVSLHDENGEVRPNAVAWTPFDVDMSARQAGRIISEWREYKDENGLYEHHDYIRECYEEGYTLDCEVLMVDEFQDFAPLEYSLIRMWIDEGDAEHAYLMGDEYQAIYGFKGSDSRYLTETEVDDEHDYELKKSYRCPSEIASVARGIIPETGMQAAEEGGRVSVNSITDAGELADAVDTMLDLHQPLNQDPILYRPAYRQKVEDPRTVFLLTRTNRQLGKVAHALETEGVPYRSVGGAKMGGARGDSDGEHYPWRDELIRITRALRAMHHGEEVQDHEAEAVLKQTDEPHKRAYDAFGARDETAIDGRVDLADAFGSRNAYDVLSELSLSSADKRRVKNVLESGREVRPGRVCIGTIHEAKGQTIPCTILLDGYTHQLERRWQEDEEFKQEEKRLYYVGVTRSEETLVVAQDFVGSRSVPLFRDGVPEPPASAEILASAEDEEVEA